MEHTTEAILNRLRELKPDFLKRYPIRDIGLFGSYARGDYSPLSDIDILVDIDGSIGMGFFRLANELEDAFGTKVDVVSRKGIKPHYLPYVEKYLIWV